MIESVIFLPYANTDPEHFLCKQQLTAKTYVNMEIKEYEDHKDGVDMMMDPVHGKLGQNIAFNPFTKRKIDVRQQTYSFFCGRCRLLDKKGRPLTMDDIKKDVEAGKRVIMIIQFKKKDLEMEPDLNIEVRSWVEQSKKLLDSDRLGDAEKLMHLPMKTLGIEVVDNKGTDKEEMLQLFYRDCKIVETKGSYTTVAVLVDRIEVYVDEEEEKNGKR